MKYASSRRLERKVSIAPIKPARPRKLPIGRPCYIFRPAAGPLAGQDLPSRTGSTLPFILGGQLGKYTAGTWVAMSYESMGFLC